MSAQLQHVMLKTTDQSRSPAVLVDSNLSVNTLKYELSTSLGSPGTGQLTVSKVRQK